MGRGTHLTSDERKLITRHLSEGLQACQIGTLLGRDTRTIKKAINNINFCRKTRSDKGTSIVSKRDKQKIRGVMKKHPLLTSAAIFSKAGVFNICKTTRNKTLRELGSMKSAQKRPPISGRNKIKRLNWAQRYMKVNFEKVIFTDECRATLDGPDGWRRGWVIEGGEAPWVVKRQQGGGGVKFCAGFVKDKLIGPYKVDTSVKINSVTYSKFLDETFFQWYRRQSRSFKLSCIFMHDNAPAHAFKYTKTYLEHKGISGSKIMTWPAQSPDLNPIENLWSIIKRRVYPADKQYNSKDELWEAIKSVCAALEPQEIENLTSDMDQRLFDVIQKTGAYIGK